MPSYLTQQRKQLLAFFKSNPHRQFTAKEIYDAIPYGAVSLSAVYRNLAALENDGIINKSAKDGSRQLVYQYTDNEDCKKSIHLICTKCSRAFHLDGAVTDELSRVLGSEMGFCLDKRKSVIYGICAQCQKKAVL